MTSEESGFVPETRTSGVPTIELAGSRVVRAGFGAARLTEGDGWGEPADREASKRLLETALESGVGYVDTADALGPGVSEAIIGEVIGNSGRARVGTKAGMLHYGPGSWGVLGRPEYLKQQAYASRIRLRVDTIDLFYLHRIDPQVPLADQIGALQELREEGVIRQIGVSEPSPEQLEQFLAIEKPAAVQSHFNVVQRRNSTILDRVETLGIPFVAYWPLAGHALDPAVKSVAFDVLSRYAAPLEITASQLALAWIVNRSPVTIPIFGSRSPRHLRENVRAVGIELDRELVSEIARSIDEAVGRSVTPSS